MGENRIANNREVAALDLSMAFTLDGSYKVGENRISSNREVAALEKYLYS